jgi:uncharacterized membrane protein YqjE
MDQSDTRGFDRSDEAIRGAAFRPPDARVRADVPAATPESLGDLVADLIKDIQDLVRGELRLARAELKADASTAGRGLGWLAAGGFVGLVALFFVGLTAATLLAKTMQDWIANGIVAVAFIVIAAFAAWYGRQKLSSTNWGPEQTVDTLKEDRAWAKQQIESVKR